MKPECMAEYRRWRDSAALTEAERRELAALEGNEAEIESRFFAPLSFGTAGLRGVMGLGLNRMNAYVIRQATVGLAELICREGPEAMARGCVVCHDCREHSREFALIAARVMAGRGVHVRLFEDLRPTPELSFAIRHYGATAGVNVTASHNPKEYNGYKVYWADGAQLPPEHAAQVAAVMAQTDVLDPSPLLSFEEARERGLIELLGRETDEAFLAKALGEAVFPEKVRQAAERLSIVYTPFHGAGRVLVPEALRRLGVTKLWPVEEQMVPDGRFPTVKSPNPEDPAGFALAAELADRVGADLLIGTDPDSDRIGVLVRDASGGFTPITGNQMGVLLIDYLLSARREAGTLPEKPAVLKTIVTTDLAKAAAEAGGAACFETFTGFKFMAEKIKQFEAEGSYQAVFAYEESYGCMAGDFVRDKDAVTAAVLMTELAAHYLLKGMSLLDAMDAIYERFGWYAEKTLNVVMPGVDGVARRQETMRRLRETPPETVGGLRVTAMRDYQTGLEREPATGAERPTALKGSDVLIWLLEDGSKLAVRPSGTEPKIKLYLLLRGSSKADCAAKMAACEKDALALCE